MRMCRRDKRAKEGVRTDAVGVWASQDVAASITQHAGTAPPPPRRREET